MQDSLYLSANAFITLFCIVSMLFRADMIPDNLLTPAELCRPPRDREEVGVSEKSHTIISIICRMRYGYNIDIIDYVTGIGNSSREQYIRAGQSVSH